MTLPVPEILNSSSLAVFHSAQLLTKLSPLIYLCQEDSRLSRFRSKASFSFTWVSLCISFPRKETPSLPHVPSPGITKQDFFSPSLWPGFANLQAFPFRSAAWLIWLWLEFGKWKECSLSSCVVEFEYYCWWAVRAQAARVKQVMTIPCCREVLEVTGALHPTGASCRSIGLYWKINWRYKSSCLVRHFY